MRMICLVGLFVLGGLSTGCGSKGAGLANRVCDCLEDAKTDATKRKACDKMATRGTREIMGDAAEMQKFTQGLLRCKDILGPG
jgi:hypothetical protein